MSVTALAEKRQDEPGQDFIEGRTMPPAEIKARAERLARLYDGVSGHALLDSLINREFKDRIALVSSFGAESASLLHLVASVNPDTPVIFVNTGKLFGETIRYRDQLIAQLGLTDVRSVRPNPAEEKALDPDGILWSKDTDACCAFRKVKPLNTALEGFDAWITGRKRFQSGTRADVPLIEATTKHIKVNPIALWEEADVEAYIAKHGLPPHPLVEDGYPSIGCMPCTDRVAPGADPRSGRWAGQEKTECGIHTEMFEDGAGI